MIKQAFSILIGVILMTTLSFATVKAMTTPAFTIVKADSHFNLMPATTKHIMATAKLMKVDKTLKVMIISYSKEVDYKSAADMVDSAKAVKDAYLHVNIDTDRVILGFANAGSMMEKEYKFRTNGVYLRLFRE